MVTDDLHDDDRHADDEGRIRHEDDPTYRPSVVPRTAPYTVTDPDALALAEQMVATGVWRPCPECDHYITTGLPVHWECSERRRKAAEAQTAALLDRDLAS